MKDDNATGAELNAVISDYIGDYSDVALERLIEEIRKIIARRKRERVAALAERDDLRAALARRGAGATRGAQVSIRKQVLEFHKRFGITIRKVPEVPLTWEVDLALRLIIEEVTELLYACGVPLDDTESLRRLFNMAVLVRGYKVDMVEVADALADIDYVVEGMRRSFGIDGEPIARKVHSANMKKVGGTKRDDGKILKPDGWEPPDIERELRLQGWEG